MTCITPGAIWPDTDGIHINAHGGGILFDAGTYYWFGEHRGDGSAGYNAKVGVTCYSSTDLVHWKNEGVALRVTEHGGPQTRADGDDIIYDKIGLDRNTDVPHGTYRIIEPGWEIEIGCILERPKVIRSSATGKYVMWFHLEFRGYGYGPAHVGVAVSDQPTGPYRFVEAFRPGNGESRDMTLFVDEEGQSYHIGASENNESPNARLLAVHRRNGACVRGSTDGGAGLLSSPGQVLLHGIGLFRVGPQYRPFGRGGFVPRPMDGAWEPLHRTQCGQNLWIAEHLLPEGAREAGRFYLYGRPLELDKSHRFSVHLVARQF